MLCVKGDSAADERADGTAESRGVKRKISLTCCDVCENEEAKYRCPNCLKFSCSLPCVKRHKLQSGCSGVRDKTAFVVLSQFSEINLLNDYRYLEETARVADKPIRDTILHTPSHTTNPKKLLNKNAVAAKVNLRLLPRSFSRHKENTSGYNKSEKKLYWHLKLHFPQSSAEYTDRVPEDRALQQILSDYIHPTESDPVKRQRLKLYVLTPPDQMCVFLKSEQRRPESPKYHELNLKNTLRENLMFKTVVEYPELHVVLREHRDEYLTKFPERKSAGQSTSLKESIPQLTPSSSRDDPAENPKHVVKKRKSIAEESELEEGEIRSEEEEEEEEEEEKEDDHDHEQREQPVCSADHADKAQNEHSMDADHGLPLHDDNDGCDGGQGGVADDRNSAMDTNDMETSSHDQGEEDDAVDAPEVNKNQDVIMETDDGKDCKDTSVEGHLLPSSSSPQDKDMGNGGDGYVGGGGDGHQGDTTKAPPLSSHDQSKESSCGQVDAVHSAANGQKLTMETNEQLSHDHSERCGGDEDEIHMTANKQIGGHSSSSSSLDKNIDDVHHSDVLQGFAANGPNITKQTNDSLSPPSTDPDQNETQQIHGGADGASVHGGDNGDKETDGHPSSSSVDTNIKNVQNDDNRHNDDLHQIAIKTSTNDRSITMESSDLPSFKDHGQEDEGLKVDDIKYDASNNVHISVMEAKSIPLSTQNTDQIPVSYDHQHVPADDQIKAPPPPRDGNVDGNNGQVDGGIDGSAAADVGAVGANGENSATVEVEHTVCLFHCEDDDENGQSQIGAAANDQDVSVTEKCTSSIESDFLDRSPE
ncbi:box C/D snoRNA protein 1 [Astyanax mexicanus]|uniref:Box C/D snoRNA protein 1 n=1 Tax=Astyanax mexicanus TaxID=7994 RepID=A0A8T2LH29_ASTMX|nr:box C/D snoRNA protein 1 [Astyanax mexicanus]